VLERLLGVEPDGQAPEGSQVKVNMLLSRLPRLRDTETPSELAFGGTFHVNESASQLQLAFEQASAGSIPSLVRRGGGVSGIPGHNAAMAALS
jgi:phytoene dehydrogenase-like protein